MSDFISDYGEQLRLAAWQRLRAHRRRPLFRLRKPAIMLVALVIAAPAVAATGIWRPLLGDGLRPAPQASVDPVPGSQREQLAVLRRTQQASDRGPQTDYALRFLTPGVADVHTADIRLLHQEPDGRGIVLIPVGQYGLESANGASAARAQPHPDGLCLFAADQDHGRPAGGGFGCYSTDQLLHGQATAALGSRVFGLVPDRVQNVEVTFARGTAITTNVHENLFIYTAPTDTAATARQVIWYDRSGDVINTLAGSSVPSPTRVDPAKSICDPRVPPAKCPSKIYAPGSRDDTNPAPRARGQLRIDR